MSQKAHHGKGLGFVTPFCCLGLMHSNRISWHGDCRIRVFDRFFVDCCTTAGNETPVLSTASALRLRFASSMTV